MENLAIVGLLFALLLRWIVALYPYSGHNNPPIFGDYEAQRHWMEITINLPPKQWYENSTDNDLLYWGLDYPPLTAYHSHFMGILANLINPDWVRLHNSRGYESYHHKLFMRSTVFVSDLLIYMSAIFFTWNSSEIKSHLRFPLLLRNLIAPTLILIDYGHFQYNCISLGLLLWTVVFLRSQMDVIAAIIFCLALNYKQMALYYSLPIFFHLLKQCVIKKPLPKAFGKFAALAVTVLLTFVIIWWPYLFNFDVTLQVVRRIFPLNRGVYEDKVANFWYCISIMIKVKKLFSESQLAIISATLTLSVSIPVCFMLFQRNSITMLKYSLLNVSLAFFMFSFQVHEKTILFVSTALMLLSDLYPFAVFWFEIIATFSLQPLLIKDGLMVSYFALSIIYITICQNSLINNKSKTNLMFGLSLLGCSMLSIATLCISPPSHLPHLHVLLNCVYSFIHFSCFLLYFLYQQIQIYNNRNQANFTHIKPKLKSG